MPRGVYDRKNGKGNKQQPKPKAHTYADLAEKHMQQPPRGVSHFITRDDKGNEYLLTCNPKFWYRISE